MLFKLKNFKIFSLLILVVLLSIPGVYGQGTKDVDARSPTPKAAKGKAKEAEKKKVEQKKLSEKAIDVGRKRHEKLQEREVRHRMKKSKRLAAANNAHKKDFFLKRWFTPKQKTKRR
jgi:hypothetical protein